jgi:hypothetical protein
MVPGGGTQGMWCQGPISSFWAARRRLGRRPAAETDEVADGALKKDVIPAADVERRVAIRP